MGVVDIGGYIVVFEDLVDWIRSPVGVEGAEIHDGMFHFLSGAFVSAYAGTSSSVLRRGQMRSQGEIYLSGNMQEVDKLGVCANVPNGVDVHGIFPEEIHNPVTAIRQ